MANIDTPISATATETAMDDTVQNPTTVVGGDTTCGTMAFITLRFVGGQTIDPAAIHDAIDAQWGTTASLKSMPARGCYIYDIST